MPSDKSRSERTATKASKAKPVARVRQHSAAPAAATRKARQTRKAGPTRKPSTPKPSTAARTRTGVHTEAQIVELALELVRREGVAALSMRGLAKQLGISVMGLYHHVPSREALLDLLWEAVLDRVPVQPVESERWEDYLRAHAAEAVALLATYPGLLEHGIARPPNAKSLRFGKQAIEVLTAAGFDPVTAALGTMTFHVYLLGTIIATQTFRALAAAHKAGTPGAGEALRYTRDVQLDAFVRFGTDIILDGLRARRRA